MTRCACCGGRRFRQAPILWPDLVTEWALTDEEVRYIDRQQGLSCTRCGCNLRSMALAHAISTAYGTRGSFLRFVLTHPRLRVLEMNPAGQLTRFLRLLPRHVLATYPDVDLMSLPYDDASFDLVVHSDTLEHVADPVQGLAESLRVLRPRGFTCFTVPILVGRLTSSREGRPASYHGTEARREYLVETEYGADAWTDVIRAGFPEVRLVSLEFPAGLAIVAPKPRRDRRSQASR